MLIATIWNWVTDIKYKIHCKHCKFASHSALVVLFHTRNHYPDFQFRPTWRDLRFVLKYNLVTRIGKLLLGCVLLVPLLVLKLVCLPFYFLYEIL